MEYRSDVAFTDAVKRAQRARGSRATYEGAMARRDWSGSITDELARFLAARDSVYLATASAEGQPYVQHRGGPAGFIKVLDRQTLAFADYKGNRQYISLGNLSENDRAFLFAMDYANRIRIKIWGRARFAEGDDALLARVSDSSYDASPERVLVFSVEAWDRNCPRHIVPRFTLEEIDSLNGGGTR